MKRKLPAILLGVCLILTIVPSAAFAETTTENVECLEEKLDEAAELVDGKEMETQLHRMPDGSYSGREVYDLGDGAQLIVEVLDTDDDSRLTGAISMAASSGSSDLWRDFGNRSFIAKATVQYIGKSITLQLTNNYTLSAKGIDIRNLVADYDRKIGNIKVKTPQITDVSARTPGASDVNGNCKFTLTANGAPKAEYQLYSTVGYVTLDKDGKRIKVRQSWSLSKL